MKRLAIILLLLCQVFVIQAQSNAERIQEIDKEIETAVQNQEYDKAQKLKEEKEVRTQIEAALKEGDFKKASELKKKLGEGNQTISKSSIEERKKPKVKKEERDPLYTTIKYNVVDDPSVQVTYPPTRIIEGKWVYPIGILNGIEISYMLEVDADADFEGYSDTYYDIDLIFRNVTNKTIYYRNAMDEVGAVNFTGEDVEIFLDNYTKRNLGGKCPFYAAFLDEENGMYAMKPNEDYYGYYTINQDSEGWLELIWLRRLKPLSCRVAIPQKYHDENAKTDFRFYPDYKQTKIENRLSKDGFVESKIKLPSKKIESTPIRRDIKLKEPLKTNGNYTIAYENEVIKIEYWIDQSKPKLKSSSGYFYYPITFRTTNKSKQKIEPWKYGDKKHVSAVARIDFKNSTYVDVKTENIKSGIVKSPELLPGESREYQTELRVIGYSGELFEAGKFSERAIESNRKFVPNYIILPNELVDGFSGKSASSSDGKTKVHVYVERTNINDMYGSLWNKDKYLLYLGMDLNNYQETKAGNSFTYELSSAGDKELFISLNSKANEKKMAKVRTGKLVISLTYLPFKVDEGSEVFIYYAYQKGLNIISKEEYEKAVGSSNINVPNTVVKM